MLSIISECRLLISCIFSPCIQVLKFLMERNSINALHGQVTVGTLILQVKGFTAFSSWQVIIKEISSNKINELYMLSNCWTSQQVDFHSGWHYLFPLGLCCWLAFCSASTSMWHFWCTSRSYINVQVVSSVTFSDFCSLSQNSFFTEVIWEFLNLIPPDFFL